MTTSPPTLEELLHLIPEDSRHRLDEKIEDRSSISRIAKTIPDWQVAAGHFSGIKPNDVEAIRYDCHLSLDLQKVRLIEKWKERNGPRATYRHLAESLYKADAVDSVHVLCTELGAPSTETDRPALPGSHPPPQHHVEHAVVPLPPPNMKDLLNYVHTTKPFELGIQLDIDTHGLKVVMKDHQNDTASQLTEVLSLYLNQTEHPSWRDMAAALLNIREVQCARAIEKKFGFKLPSEGLRTPPGDEQPPAPHYHYPMQYPAHTPYHGAQPGYSYHPPWAHTAGVPRYGYPPVHPYYGPPGTVPNPYVYPGPLPTTGHSPMQDPSAKSNVATVTSGDSTLIPQPTHFQKTVKRSDRVDLMALMKFTSQSGTINILQRVGPHYKPMLGNVLLKSPDGTRVQTIEKTHRGNVDDVVYDIFRIWCTHDAECTWDKLVLHLRESQLNFLADDIDAALI